MTYDLLWAFVLFALVSSLTPGPNNLMLMASGANFGFRRSIPHMLGIGIGFTLMIVLVGLGLAQVFTTYPVAHKILKAVSAIYLSWLAWKIANAAAPQDGDSEGRPFSFLQAAAFQWVNPKAWAMALTAVTVYSPDQTLNAILLVAGIFGVINIPSVSIWALIGQGIRRFLTRPIRLKIFNWSMAGLLILSLYPVLRL